MDGFIPVSSRHRRGFSNKTAKVLRDNLLQHTVLASPASLTKKEAQYDISKDDILR
jgi:hypothetical protein